MTNETFQKITQLQDALIAEQKEVLKLMKEIEELKTLFNKAMEAWQKDMEKRK